VAGNAWEQRHSTSFAANYDFAEFRSDAAAALIKPPDLDIEGCPFRYKVGEIDPPGQDWQIN
jgi:hypothetical protein